MKEELRRHWDLASIVLLTGILIPIVYLLPDNPLRIVIGLPFILFFPGYVLIATLFPEKESIDLVERVALSFGLSIAITPLIGLGLNYTPFGIRLDPILASVSAFNILFSFTAYYRRKGAKEPFLPVQLPAVVHYVRKNLKGGTKIDRALNIILVISIAASLIALVYVIAVPKQGEKFTEFYILGPDGKAHNYPTNLTVGENATIIIGIANHEYREVNYAVEIWLVDSSFVNNTTVVNHMYFFDSFSVSLAHTPVNLEGNWTPQWELRYNFSLEMPGQYKMWFLLFKDQQPFEGIKYQDHVDSGMGSRIVDAIEGRILSLNLSMNVEE
ncbi:MAG: DUF1616 domain-containing protein [Methanomassiliicoccales archaeon]|nr:DUF1616 domain-containing protein [Methanomassiliicoccales archaeon]